MLAALDVLAGIAWDPQVRGVLTVLTGATVLFGSVWLILGTNSGFRLATLIAGAGLFGFLTLLAGYWWVTSPNAWKGDDPAWVVVDINTDDHSSSVVDDVRDLPDHDDLIEQYGTAYELVVASDSEVAQSEFDSPPSDIELEGLSPEEQERLIADRQLRNETISYSDVEGADPAVLEEAGVDFGGWKIMSSADAGEAQAVAAAELEELGVFGAPSEFLNLEAYQIGGKPGLPDDPNRWDRVRHWTTNSLRLTHPPHYAVVQVQAVDQARIDELTVPGEPPPRPTVDEAAPVISVVMERDLGNRRLPPALLTIACGLIFAALCYMLHVRDKRAMENVAAGSRS